MTSGPILATGVAALITLIAQTILLRTLPINDAGMFAVAVALVDTLSLVGALGQATLITRTYGGTPDRPYDWVRDLLRLTALSTLPIALGTFVIMAFYPLSTASLLLVAAAALCTIPVHLSAYMLNARLHHTWGALLLRLPNSLLILPAMSLLILPGLGGIDYVLAAYLTGIVAVLALTLLLLSRHIERGDRRLSLRQHLEGTIFLVAGGSSLLLDQGLVAVAGALVEPATIAGFAAIAILLRPFRLVASILSMVFVPRFMRVDRASYARPLIGLALLAGAAAAIAIPAGPHLASAIYGSRYADAYWLVPWLAVIGFLQVVRVLPSSHMAGRAPVPFINRVILTEAAFVIAVALGTIVLIAKFGLFGLAVGLATGHTARTTVSFGLWRRFRRTDAARGKAISR